jgi:hypothetical protein
MRSAIEHNRGVNVAHTVHKSALVRDTTSLFIPTRAFAEAELSKRILLAISQVKGSVWFIPAKR